MIAYYVLALLVALFIAVLVAGAFVRSNTKRLPPTSKFNPEDAANTPISDDEYVDSSDIHHQTHEKKIGLHRNLTHRAGLVSARSL